MADLREQFAASEKKLVQVRSQSVPEPVMFLARNWKVLVGALAFCLGLYAKHAPASLGENLARWVAKALNCLKWLVRVAKWYLVRAAQSSVWYKVGATVKRGAVAVLKAGDAVHSVTPTTVVDFMVRHRVEAAIVEEICRFTIPQTSAVFSVSDALLAGTVHGLGAGFGVFGLHSICSAFTFMGPIGFIPAVAFHTWFNRHVPVGSGVAAGSLVENIARAFGSVYRWFAPSTESRYEEFLRLHNECKPYEGEYVGWDRVLAGSSIMPRVANSIVVPEGEKFRGNITIRVAGLLVTPAQAADLLRYNAPDPTNRIYPIAVTSGLLYQPAACSYNLLKAIIERTHVNFFVGKPDAATRHVAWFRLASELVAQGFYGSPVQAKQPFAECIRLMGSKGARIAEAHEQDVKGNNFRVDKSISLKWNETIPAKSQRDPCDPDGYGEIKPRPIINYHPIVHSRLTQWSRAVATHFKSVHDGAVMSLFGKTVRFFYVSGYTHRQMCALGEAIVSGDTVVVCSGDDSVVAWGRLSYLFGGLPYGECDAEKFEQTQDEGPTIIATGVWMPAIGVPREVVDETHRAIAMPYSVRKRDMRIDGNNGIQMPSGIPWTTVLNTVADEELYCMSLRDNVTPEEAAHTLGFTVKYHGHHSVHDLTFLRGWWCPSVAGLVWLPLPSAILKAGKVMRDPRYIYPSRDSEESVRKTAFAIASSYGHIPLHYPIFGPFIGMLRRLGVFCEVFGKDIGEGWERPQVEVGTDVDRPFVLEMIEKRYGLVYNEVVQMERTMAEVKSLPAILYHPGYQRLVAVDYA